MLLTKCGSIPASGGASFMLDGWSYGAKINIPAGLVDDDLPYFPLPLYLNSANINFSKFKPDGSDVRFTDKNLNHLKFERKEHVVIPSDTIMLYANGTEYNTDITGGFIKAKGTDNTDNWVNSGYGFKLAMSGSYRGASIVTAKKVNVKGYRLIVIADVAEMGATSGVTFGLSSTSPTVTNCRTCEIAPYVVNTVGSGQKFTIDFAAQSDNYIQIAAGTSTASETIYVEILTMYLSPVPTTDLVLYENGDEKYSTTGGWGGTPYGDGVTVITKNSTNMKIKMTTTTSPPRANGIINNTPISFRYYKNVKVTLTSDVANLTFKLRVTTSTDYGTGVIKEVTVTAPSTANTPFTITLDTADVVGNYYIGMYQLMTSGTPSFTITKVWQQPKYGSKGIYHVLVPKVSNLEDTAIYMWGGNPNAYNASIESWQDQTGKQLTYVGNVKLTTGVVANSRSAYFDGTGDCFTLGGQSDFAFGTGNFCIEIDFIKKSLGFKIIYDSRSGNNGDYMMIFVDSNEKLSVFIGNTQVIISSSTVLLNVINRISVTKNGTTLRLFLNNILVGSTTNTTSFLNMPSRPIIGRSGYCDEARWSGYILGMRITKGRARYTTNYTPPTKFEIDGSDVVFCTNFDTIYDQYYAMVQHMGDSLVDATGNANNGTATGTTVVDTEYGKIRFIDGVDDSIATPSTSISADNADFTILAMQLVDDSTNFLIMSKGSAGTDTLLHVGMSDTKYMMRFSSDDLDVVMPNPDINTWYAVGYRFIKALKEQKVYAAGVNVGTRTSAGVLSGTNASSLILGKLLTTYGNGYYGELRTSNIARSDAWIKAESLALNRMLLTVTEV